jgi:hypothetical protein
MSNFYDQVWDACTEKARVHIQQGKNIEAPYIYAFAGVNGIEFQMPSWNDNYGVKYRLLNDLHHYLKHRNIDTYVLVTEAWMSMVLPDSDGTVKRKYDQPSQDPNRLDVLMTSMSNIKGPVRSDGKKISKKFVKGRRKVVLEEIKIPGFDNVSPSNMSADGTFSNLLLPFEQNFKDDGMDMEKSPRRPPIVTPDEMERILRPIPFSLKIKK